MQKKNDKVDAYKKIFLDLIVRKIQIFKKQNQIQFYETRTIRKSILKILKDIRTLKNKITQYY